MGSKHIVVRTTVAATIGGTASKLSGGKFANGAVTSAFQHLFNQEATKPEVEPPSEVLVLLEERLGGSPSMIARGDRNSDIKVRDRWWSAASEIREAFPDAILTVQSYSTPDELRSLILETRADKILISAHGGTGYFDAGGGDTNRSARVWIDDFKKGYTTETFRKIQFHHCPTGGQTSFVDGINILRGYFNLPGKTIKDYKFRQ